MPSKRRTKRASDEFRNKVTRLSCLDGPFMEPAAWDALVEAFEKWVGEEHIDEAIDAFLLDPSHKRPTPGHVEAMSKANLWTLSLADKLRTLADKQNCPECSNTGWRQEPVPNRPGLTQARLCTCHIGRLISHRKQREVA